ncbi:MAG: prepilin-type N-terminal cleavage/methylation domain-containing protein [Vampirovibrionales bacterium]
MLDVLVNVVDIKECCMLKTGAMVQARRNDTLVKQGFSLIELALIIAIIGILAALTATQFVDLTANAEKSLLQDFGQKLTSSLSSFVAAKGRFPSPTDTDGGFKEFVADYGPAPSFAPNLGTGDNRKFIGLPILKGDKAICALTSATLITCNDEELVGFNATYTYVNGGVVTSITAVGTSTPTP